MKIDLGYLLRLLKQMIRINSVIPREALLAEFIADEIETLGLEPEWHEVAPGRPNVYTSINLGPVDRFLTLTGHMDTVDVAGGWSIDPFEPTERNGRLYGLGAMDMKAGLACALATLKSLIEATSLHSKLGRVGFAATVDEEGYGSGAKALLRTAYADSDGMLLGEPFYGTGLQDPLPIGMTGKVLYTLTVRGRAAHGFYPERGVNAVEDACRIVAALDQLHIGVDSVIGNGSYSTLKITGGYEEYAVVVPEECEVIVTRLTVPGESKETARRDVDRLIQSLALKSEVTVEIVPPFYEPYLLDENSSLLKCFRQAYRNVFAKTPTFSGRRGITDANIYITEGHIPTVVFGPRGEGAHEAGEYVELATLEPVARTYAEVAQLFFDSDE